MFGDYSHVKNLAMLACASCFKLHTEQSNLSYKNQCQFLSSSQTRLYPKKKIVGQNIRQTKTCRQAKEVRWSSTIHWYQGEHGE